MMGRPPKYNVPDYKSYPKISNDEYIARCLNCTLDDCEPTDMECNLRGYINLYNNHVTTNVEKKVRTHTYFTSGIVPENLDGDGMEVHRLWL